MDKNTAASGMIHIYHGDGKGKTTAAIGLLVRAAGHGYRVMLVQFLKNGRSGEIEALKHLPQVSVVVAPQIDKFTCNMSLQEKEETRGYHQALFNACKAAAFKGELDLLVLDEVLDAINTKLLDEEELLSFLRAKPRTLEVVLTGRQPSAEMLELADYISEIRCCRHPYQKGIAARKGIEY